MSLFDDLTYFLKWAFTGIEFSVGAGGRNRPDDVKKIQILLNAHPRYAGRKLRTDSDCGPNTRRAILAFQRSQVKGIIPDGRVDPGGKTFTTLCSHKSSGRGGGSSAAKLPAVISRFEDEMRSIFDDDDWRDFISALESGKIPNVKRYLERVSQTIPAKEFAKVFVMLKKWGCRPVDINDLFDHVNKIGVSKTTKVFAEITRGIGDTASLFKTISNASAKTELFIALLDCLRYTKQNNYGRIFTRLIDLSVKHPPTLVTLVNGLQGIALVSMPEHRAKFTAFRKIISVVNPVRLSKPVVNVLEDFVDVGVQKAVMGNGNNIYTILAKLADRLQMSTTKTVRVAGKTTEQLAKELFGKTTKNAWEDFIDVIT